MIDVASMQETTEAFHTGALVTENEHLILLASRRREDAEQFFHHSKILVSAWIYKHDGKALR